MKKFIAIAFLFLISIHFGFAQSYLGIKVGANLSRVNIDNSYSSLFNVNIDNRVGYQFGLIAQKNINDKFYVRPELFYSSKGYKISSSPNPEYNTPVRYSYINLPVLIGYKLTPEFSALLGPQLGLLGKVIGKDENGERYNLYSEQDYNTFDFSIGAGVSYRFTTRISADLRYNYGLTTIVSSNYLDESGNEITSDLVKNNKSVEFSINYLFKFKEKKFSL